MGYVVFQDTKCIDQTKLVTNCISYSQNIQCEQCQVGYNLIFDNVSLAYGCQIKDPLCMQYDNQTQLCKQCVSGAVI